jgi:hypothetical protein
MKMSDCIFFSMVFIQDKEAGKYIFYKFDEKGKGIGNKYIL